MAEPAGLSTDQIEGIASRHRVAWLRAEPRGEKPPGIGSDHYRDFRRHVTREELEMRFQVHGRVIEDLLRRIARRSDAQTRADLARVVDWMREDRVRLVRDLFEREVYSPDRDEARPSKWPAAVVEPEAERLLTE